MTEDKGIKLLVKRLQSGNTKDILFTINQIKNTGDPKILPFLFDLMISEPPKEVSSAIIELLNDLKNQACTIEIVKALESAKYFAIRKELLTSCWYSGLDYSDFLSLFVQIFIANDFLIAFEAFTLIETFEKEYDTLFINNLIDDLKSNITNISHEKSNLLVELVHVLDNKKLSS